MNTKNKGKKGFFDLNMFGLKLSPLWGLAIGLVLSTLFSGSLLGSIGAIIFLIAIIKLIAGFFRKKQSPTHSEKHQEIDLGFCHKCGRGLDTNSKFCSKCGAKILISTNK